MEWLQIKFFIFEYSREATVFAGFNFLKTDLGKTTPLKYYR